MCLLNLKEELERGRDFLKSETLFKRVRNLPVVFVFEEPSESSIQFLLTTQSPPDRSRRELLLRRKTMCSARYSERRMSISDL